MKAYYPLFIFCCLMTPLRAWGQALTELLDQAKQQVVTVETQKYRYEQSLEYATDRPWRITVSIDKSNLKNGKGETNSYTFNLGDLDIRTLNYQTDKDEQIVVLKCPKRKTLIKVVDDEEETEYDDALTLWSPEIDNAKALRDLLRAAIPLAQDQWKAYFSPDTTLVGINNWLTTNIKSDSRNDLSWSKGKYNDHVVVRIEREDGEIIEYSLSLADVAKDAIALSVRKATVSVYVGATDKDDLFKVTEDGELVDYTNGFSLPAASIDQARMIIQSLENALPLARQLRKSRMPNPNSLDEGLKLLSDLLLPVTRKGSLLTPKMQPNRICEMVITKRDNDKGEETTVKTVHDFGDLDPKKITTAIKGTAINVIAKVAGGEDYVQYWEADEPDGFDDEIVWPAASVEASHRIKYLLPYLIQEAGKISVPTGDFAWLSEAIAAAGKTSTSQQLTLNGDDCKWRLVVSTDGKKPSELVYEFNLYNLAPKQVSFTTGKIDPQLVLFTKKKEEVINVFDNGEPEFTDELYINMSSLADAKKATATTRQLVEGCPEE